MAFDGDVKARSSKAPALLGTDLVWDGVSLGGEWLALRRSQLAKWIACGRGSEALRLLQERGDLCVQVARGGGCFLDHPRVLLRRSVHGGNRFVDLADA